MPLEDAPAGDRKRVRLESDSETVRGEGEIAAKPSEAEAVGEEDAVSGDSFGVGEGEGGGGGSSSSGSEPEYDLTAEYEQDYLACRTMTEKIKSLVIQKIGGPNEEDRRSVELCISRGRCSFTKSHQPPPVILQDNETLKEYQVAAVHWLLTLFENGYNGLLADDMGLGKSAESICFLKRLYVDGLLTKPTIITCPTTLLDNWMAELKRWAPGLKVMRYHGSQIERRWLMRQFELGSDYEDESEVASGDLDSHDQGPADEATMEDSAEHESQMDESSEVNALSSAPNSNAANSDTGPSEAPPPAPPPSPEEELSEPTPIEYYSLPEGVAYHVLVTSHPTLASSHDCQHFFKVQEFGFLIVDEAHGLKNAASNRYQQINKSVRAPLRLLLTGSPIQNQMSELKNLLGFLNPYRGAESFSLEKALAYHRRVWEQALEREKQREALKSSLPALITEAEKVDPDSSATNAEAASKSAVGRGDPEIHFYQQLLAPLILRRLKSEVIHNFPTKTSKIELLDMHPVQLQLYQKELRASKGMLAASAKGGVAKRTSQTAIKGLIFRLRRICNHPLLLQSYFTPDDRREFASYLQSKVKEYRKFSLERVMQHIQDWSDFDLHNEAYHHLPALQNFRIPKEQFGFGCKTNRLLELIQEKCVQRNEKMLIFSQFTTYLDIIQEFLRLYCADVEHLRLDGSTAVNDRSAMVSSFQNNTSDAKLFLLSTKAGGVGLNLTSSNTVVLMDQDWNPHNDRQAEDRVHRLGQKGDVTVYRLCCRHSFEESILSCCKRKLELDEAFGGVQEALPLAIFEEILRDAQSIASNPPSDNSASPAPATEEEESRPAPAKKVVKARNADTEATVKAKPTVAATKRTAKKAKDEANAASKKTVKRNGTKKNVRKQTAVAKDIPSHVNSLLPGGDSD